MIKFHLISCVAVFISIGVSSAIEVAPILGAPPGREYELPSTTPILEPNSAIPTLEKEFFIEEEDTIIETTLGPADVEQFRTGGFTENYDGISAPIQQTEYGYYNEARQVNGGYEEEFIGGMSGRTLGGGVEQYFEESDSYISEVDPTQLGYFSGMAYGEGELITDEPVQDITIVEANEIIVDPDFLIPSVEDNLEGRLFVDRYQSGRTTGLQQRPVVTKSIRRLPIPSSSSSYASPFSAGYGMSRSFGAAYAAPQSFGAAPMTAGYPMSPAMPYYGGFGGMSSSYSSRSVTRSGGGGGGGGGCGCCCCCCCEPEQIVQIQQVPQPIPIPQPVPQPPLIIVKRKKADIIHPPPAPITTTEVVVKETVMDPVTTVIDPLVVNEQAYAGRSMQSISRCVPNGGQVGRINSMLAQAMTDHVLPDEYRVVHLSRSVGDQYRYRIGLSATGGGCRTYELLSPFSGRGVTLGEIIPSSCPNMNAMDIPNCEAGIFGY